MQSTGTAGEWEAFLLRTDKLNFRITRAERMPSLRQFGRSELFLMLRLVPDFSRCAGGRKWAIVSVIVCLNLKRNAVFNLELRAKQTSPGLFFTNIKGRLSKVTTNKWGSACHCTFFWRNPPARGPMSWVGSARTRTEHDLQDLLEQQKDKPRRCW